MLTFHPCTFQEQQQGRLRTLAQDERQCRSYLTLARETVEMFHYLTQVSRIVTWTPICYYSSLFKHHLRRPPHMQIILLEA